MKITIYPTNLLNSFYEDCDSDIFKEACDLARGMNKNDKATVEAVDSLRDLARLYQLTITTKANQKSKKITIDKIVLQRV
jgi:hypothetical protein